MPRRRYTLGDCSFEALTDGPRWLGLGTVTVAGRRVRSGRLPLRPCTQSYRGHELAELRLLGVKRSPREVRFRLRALFRPMPVKLLRDHSFDPIHETGDWAVAPVSGEGRLDLVLRPARDAFNGVRFHGFSYHYEYRGAVPLFYLLDQASWELGGDVRGATAVSQSSCSAPVATFAHDTFWTTEGLIHWDDAASKANPVMTHNLPRWASHQAFDFQYKGDATLLGVFARVALIRSVLRREAGKPELKTFDKHIFDQATAVHTTPKAILLNAEPRTATAQRNLWTWVFDEVHGRARAEYGLKEVPFRPRLALNLWNRFVFDDYRKNLIPAAKSIGVRELFIDNTNKSAQTEGSPHASFHWNMCCGHEYETAPKLGGPKMLERLVADCRRLGIQLVSWTNNTQALSSPVNNSERDDKKWFVRMEDTRLKFGGAYTNVMSILNFRKPEPRRYWLGCLKKIKRNTGLAMYLYDSFYNLGFMPVSYEGGAPATQWRGLLQAFREAQRAGINFYIESFGPFGRVQHGCPRSYNLENIFACYRIGLGNDYTTIPTGQEVKERAAREAWQLYYILAHMTDPNIPLFIDGQRIDKLWTAAHRQALADYHAAHPFLHRRYLQEDGQSVLWHDRAGRRATLFNLAARTVTLRGRVVDVTTGRRLTGKRHRLEACHTYAITGAKLPRAVNGTT
jgi:hypothetical protein